MPDFVDESDMEEYRDMLNELLDVEKGLSNWDIDFLDSLNDWNGDFTVRQAETLEKIYKKVL